MGLKDRFQSFCYAVYMRGLRAFAVVPFVSLAIGIFLVVGAQLQWFKCPWIIGIALIAFGVGYIFGSDSTDG